MRKVMEISKLQWFDIPNYDGLYQVNEYGDIRSTNYKCNGSTCILKPRIIRGYYCVDLYLRTKRKTVRNHQMVAIIFLGHNLDNPNITVNHKDFNSLNNHKDNLEIITLRENSSYKRNRGNRLIGTHYNKRNGKFTASIYYKNKRYTLGHFDYEIDANNAYSKALYNIENNIPIVEYKPKKTSIHKNIHFSSLNNKWRVNLNINGFCYCRSFDSEILELEALNDVKDKILNGVEINKRKNSSLFIGVSKDNNNNLWKCHINKLFIGRFLTEIDAKKARDNALALLNEGHDIKDIRKSCKFKLRKGFTH